MDNHLLKTIEVEETGKPVIFIPLEDEASRKHYQSCGAKIRTISCGSAMSKLYAILEVETIEQAKDLQKVFDASDRRKKRYEKKQAENETSFDALVENGYEGLSENGDPMDITIHTMMLDALVKEVAELTEKKRRYVEMVKNGEKQTDVAKELGISQPSVNQAKNKVLEELHHKMRHFED